MDRTEPKTLHPLVELYVTFFKIGIMTFGGGYAMLPLLQTEIVEKHAWATKEEILNYFAVGQCTPGIIAVNTSTFIGYKRAKIPGGIIATLGFISPSILIILVIAKILNQFMDNVWVAHAFAGIRAAVCALVLKSIISMWKSGVKNAGGIILFLIAFVLVAFVGLSSVWPVICTMVLGILLQVRREYKGRFGREKGGGGS